MATRSETFLNRLHETKKLIQKFSFEKYLDRLFPNQSIFLFLPEVGFLLTKLNFSDSCSFLFQTETLEK